MPSKQQLIAQVNYLDGQFTQKSYCFKISEGSIVLLLFGADTRRKRKRNALRSQLTLIESSQQLTRDPKTNILRSL